MWIGFTIFTSFTSSFLLTPRNIGLESHRKDRFVGMFINFIIAYIVSSKTSPPPSEIQEIVENIRIPKGVGKATGH